MKLKDQLSNVLIGAIKEAHNKHSETFRLFFDMAENQTSDARTLYYTFFQGDEATMTLMNKSLVDDYPLTVCSKCNKRPTYYVNSVQKVSIEGIIRQICGKNFVFGQNHIKQYSYDCYRQLVYIAVAMALVKYDVKTLYKEHIFFTAIATMFYFFRVFDDAGNYIVQPSDIATLLAEILDCDLSVFT